MIMVFKKIVLGMSLPSRLLGLGNLGLVHPLVPNDAVRSSGFSANSSRHWKGILGWTPSSPAI
jgi:hypothetical protein